MAESGTDQVAVTESIAEEAAETISEKAAETIAEEVAEKVAETEEAVAEVTAGTIAEDMAENVTDEVAETEIVTVKAAETKEVVKRYGSPLLITAKHCKFANVTIGKIGKNGP